MFNISEEKKKKIKSFKRKLTNTFNEYPFAVLVIENEKLKLININNLNIKDVTAEPLNSLELDNFLELIHDSDITLMQKYLEKLSIGKLERKNRCCIRLKGDNQNDKWFEFCSLKLKKENSLIISINDISKRKLLETSLKRRKIFEKFLSEISSQFIGRKEFEKGLYEAFKQIENYTKINGFHLYILGDNASKIENTYNYTKSQFDSKQKESTLKIKIILSYILEELKKKEFILLKREDRTIPNNKIRNFFFDNEILDSVLLIPLKIKEKIIGIFRLDNIYNKFIWRPSDFEFIKVFAKLLGNAIEKEKNESQILRSENKCKKILDNINESYFEIDLDGKITFVNSAFSDFAKKSKGELIGESYSKYFTIFEDKGLNNSLNLLKNEVKDAINIECTIKMEPEDLIYTDCSIYARKNDQNEIIGYSILARNITDKKLKELSKDEYNKKLENEVKNRTKKLHESLEKQKLYQKEILKNSQFKTEFLSTMSHELRTPLNAIIGFTDLLLEETFGKLNRQQLEYLKDIKESAEYQYEMISNILDISKIEAGQIKLNLKEFSLQSVIDRVVSSVKSSIKNKNLIFKIEGLEDNITMYADPIRFKEILLNLLTNAIKFTIEGSIKLIIKESFDRWIFKVRDTGIGIAKKDFDLIFKEFKRIDSSYVRSTTGTGLGLSITKRLVNLHGGQISFTSVLGVGTTFTFFIPKNISEESLSILK